MFFIRKTTRFISLYFLFWTLLFPVLRVQALVVIEGDEAFQTKLKKEWELMKEGKRGIVSKTLIEKLEASSSTTTIRPVTQDEETWHPNDRKGTRSFVLPVDTKIRGSARLTPTAAVLYLHPNRIDPTLSLFRLGTFAYELSTAMDLNYGQYSGDFKVREKRATFYRNAWCDSQKFPLIEMSGRVPAKEYQAAKAKGLIVEENALYFPILDAANFAPAPAPQPGG